MFTNDFREKPYWWEAGEPGAGSANSHKVSGSTDVAVIGAGITGLITALHLARGGAHVMVLDSDEIGAGAARRNAGMLGRSSKKSLSALCKSHGRDAAVAIYKELDLSLKKVIDFIEDEQIDCDLDMRGRVILSTSEAHHKGLHESLEFSKELLGFTYDLLGPEEVRSEIASDRYCGGAIVHNLGAFHPGKFHAALVEKAKSAGVQFEGHAEVVKIEDELNGKLVKTTRGDLHARYVAVTTNGYTTTTGSLRWMARRLVPFSAFMITTEDIGAERIGELFPNGRPCVDTNMNPDFLRAAPDSNRVMFGGRTGGPAKTGGEMAPQLLDRLTRILPDLEGVRVSHAWTGKCAATFDLLPHIGEHDGVHYALGYCFSGINLGVHFGELLAQRILRRASEPSVFDVKRFPTMPFYTGNPWFLPMAMRYYDWKDWRLERS